MSSTKKDLAGIGQSAAIGIGAALAGSLILWALTKALGVSFETKNELAMGGTTIGAPLIITTVLVVSVAAALGYAVLNRVLDNPKRAFQTVTALAGLMSFGGPFSEAVETSTLITLLVFHVFVTAVTVWAHTLRPVGAAQLAAQVSSA